MSHLVPMDRRCLTPGCRQPPCGVLLIGNDAGPDASATMCLQCIADFTAFIAKERAGQVVTHIGPWSAIPFL